MVFIVCRFEKCRILTEKVTGPSEELSAALPGMVVVRVKSDFLSLVQDLHECSNLPLLTLSGDLGLGYVHKGMKVTRSVTEVSLGGSHIVRGEADNWMEEVVAALKKVCVGYVCACIMRTPV